MADITSIKMQSKIFYTSALETEMTELRSIEEQTMLLNIYGT